MKLVDVNILLYAVDQDAVQHERVRVWLERTLNSEEPLALSWIVLLGFLRISTNPKAFPRAIAVERALKHVEFWRSCPTARLVQESDEHWQTMRQLVLDSGTSGNRTTDAHLAALAMSHNATLVSCDNDFARFRGLRWENPLH